MKPKYDVYVDLSIDAISPNLAAYYRKLAVKYAKEYIAVSFASAITDRAKVAVVRKEIDRLNSVFPITITCTSEDPYVNTKYSIYMGNLPKGIRELY